jgi:hypothetical protein
MVVKRKSPAVGKSNSGSHKMPDGKMMKNSSMKKGKK